MSGYFAELSKGLDAFCLDSRNLRGVLKREVGIVQGERIDSCKTNLSDESWVDENCCSKTEFDDPLAGGEDCDITSVFKMNSRICKPESLDSNHDTLKTESERAFMAFCWQYGIPYLPGSTSEKENVYTQNNGGEQQSSGNPNAGSSKGESKESAKSQGGNSSGKNNPPNPTPSRSTIAGAGGGEKPPPKDDSSSSDTDFTASTVNLFETLPPTTTTVDPTSSMISLASTTRTRTKKLRKRRIIPLGKQAEEKAQNKHPIPSAAASITSIASTVQSVSTRSPKQRKFVRIKGGEVDREHLQIRTFSVTGKKQKTANLNQKAISMKKMNEKDFALPAPTAKSEKIVVDQKPSALRIPKHQSQLSSKSVHISYQESTVAPSEVASSQIQMSRLSTVSSRPVHDYQSQIHHHYHHQSSSAFYHRIVDKNKLRKEKNNEWLYWSNTDESMDEDAEDREKARDPKTKGRPVDPDLYVFTGSLKRLDRLNSMLGLNPYKKVVRSNKSIQVKWHTKSLEFFGVCLNAIIFTIFTLSIIFSLHFFFSLREPFSASRAIVQDDFANNLAPTLFFVFITGFLSIWSISCIMELGPGYAQFMTRFNLAICLVRYDVSEGLHKMVHRHLLGVATFLTFIIILFFAGRKETAAVRESCGFLGFCILRPFDFKLRESVYFPLVEIFGLVVFVHGFLCFNLVLLQFAVYGKAVGNMAKCLNLRVAYGLGKIVEFLPDGTNKRIKKVIPYQKLHAEHLIIASLYRNMSQTNTIVFDTFFLTMGLQIGLTVWMVFKTFIVNSPDPKMWYLETVGSIDIAVPLRAKEFKTEEVVAMFIQLDITMLTYWLFGGVFHIAGEYMQYCVEYVRRHGLTLCKSSNERRFILSMIVSNAPKNPYWIGRQFIMNRAFLVGFLSFVTAASMVTINFHPKRTALTSIEKCSSSGICTSFKIAHGNLDILYAAVQIPISDDSPVTEEPTTTTTHSPMDIAINKYDSEIMFFPTCGSSSTLPYSSKEYVSTCPATWEEKEHGHLYPLKIKFPLFYTKVKYHDSQSDPKALLSSPPMKLEFYKRLKEPFQSWKDSRTSSCRSQTLRKLNIPKNSTHQLVDCFGDEINPDDMDDCGNLNTSSPQDGKAVSARLRAVHIYSLPGLQDDILCCYHYPGIDRDAHQLQVCNMPNPATYKSVCKIGKRKSRMSDKRVLKHYGRLLNRLNYERSKSGTAYFLNKNEEMIKGCQCPPFDDVILNGCFCSAYYLPPCLEGYFTGASEDYAVPCGGVYAPLLYEMNINRSVIFPARHIRFGNICPKAFPPGTIDYSYQLTTIANPIMSTCAASADIKGTQFTLSDCSGTPISHIKKDDCSNWDISTPDAISGKMARTQLTLRALNYDPTLKQITDKNQLDTKLFVCCYQYASQVFQTETQMRFCNAPNAEVANTVNWCGKVAANGIRNPTPFDSKIHQQLSKKLELTIQYKKKKGKGTWLYDTQINLRWTMCMCSNMWDGLTPKAFDELKKQCILDITPPHELHAEGIIDVNPSCPHNWPRKKNIPKIKTAAVFIFENGIWEMSDRFQKIGSSQTSQCNEDYTFQERPRKGRGSSPIYDAYLKKVDLNQVDDCRNLNIAVKPTGFKERKLPRLTLVLEYGMNSYDPNHFKVSENVYCCYHYETFGEQWRVCNMPDAQSVMNKCKKTKDPIRKRHERELVRKMLVHHKGAYELGNMITMHEYPDDLSWNSEQEMNWKKCICDRSPSNSNADKECELQYLPPCVVPRTDKPYPSHLEETYTLCNTKWPKGWPTALHLPIVMKYPSGTFIREPLFMEGSKSLDCPTAMARPVTEYFPNSFADCFGNIMNSVKHDECGNPNVTTPVRNDLTRKSLPKIRLIALNQIPGFPSDDQRFFCCFQYENGEANEVKVCNKPSKNLIESHCSHSTRPASVSGFVQKLKIERLFETDFLANAVDFNVDERVRWTNCICSAKLDTCKSIFPPGLKNPPCFQMTKAPWLDRMFYECQVTEPKNGEHPLWKSVNRKIPYIYPQIFRQLSSKRYKPLLTIQPKYCKPFNIKKPLLAEIEPVDLSISTPVYDCKQEKYPEKNDFDYKDDLGNLVLRGKVQSKSGSWLEASEFRLVPLNTTYRFLCCVEYNRGNGFDDVSARQAETCSMPNFKVLIKQLNKIRTKFEDPKTYDEEMHAIFHKKIKDMNERDRSKELRNPENIKCLCFHLKSVLNHEIYGTPDSKTCGKLFPGAKGRRGGIWDLFDKLGSLIGGTLG